jgi:glycosyltransferase 2 family protein
VGHVVPGGFGGDASLTIELGTEDGHGPVLASLIASRLAGCIAMAAWSVVGAAFLAPHLGVGPVLVTASVLAAVLGAAALALSSRAPRRWGRLAELTLALRAHRSQKCRVAAAFAAAAAGWAVNLVALEAFARSVGAAVPWPVLAVSLPAALTVTVLPVSINGLGLREGVLVALLLHAGVLPATAAALAVLADLQPMPFALAGGVMWLARTATAARRAARRAPAPVAALA